MAKQGGNSGKRGRGRPRGSGKDKKRKRVTVQFLSRTHAGKVTEPYEIMDRLIKTERADLKDVKIGIAWRIGWRVDADGVLTLGQCCKRGDLDRELDEFDFIIKLNKDAWPTLNPEHKERLIFHELEHAQLSLDSNGEPKRNDRGRLVCRIKKHDFGEFRSVVKKYGLDDDLSKIAQAGINDAQRPLLAEMTKENLKRKNNKAKQKSMQQTVTATEDASS